MALTSLASGGDARCRFVCAVMRFGRTVVCPFVLSLSASVTHALASVSDVFPFPHRPHGITAPWWKQKDTVRREGKPKSSAYNGRGGSGSAHGRVTREPVSGSCLHIHGIHSRLGVFRVLSPSALRSSAGRDCSVAFAAFMCTLFAALNLSPLFRVLAGLEQRTGQHVAK